MNPLRHPIAPRLATYAAWSSMSSQMGKERSCAPGTGCSVPGNVGAEVSEALEQGWKADEGIADLGHVVPGSVGVVETRTKTHSQMLLPVQAMAGSAASSPPAPSRQFAVIRHPSRVSAGPHTKGQIGLETGTKRDEVGAKSRESVVEPARGPGRLRVRRSATSLRRRINLRRVAGIL